MTSSVANLVDEFQLLETVTERLPESFSQKVLKYPKATSFYNASKNRYKDILAKEETRVCLQPIDGIPDSDYINANYVTHDTSVYICCQAPLPSTVHDFWRMVWEQEASIIVMLTELYSKEGELKAHCYWPSSTALYLAFGNLKIRLLEQTQEGDIWIRHFEITMVKDEYEEQRKLTQLQYTGWPDFSVPSTSTEFKRLLKMTDKYKDKTCKEDGGKRPIVVHCSAGIGRTGVYVAGRICLKHAKEGKQFSVFNIVRTLREQRTGMVQTPQQYIFLHTLINSYIPAKRRSLHFSSK